jgi:uncharacterized protein with PIN domain
MYDIRDRGTLKFVLDGMLGKLTRWLRMLGQDAIYAGALDDQALIEVAKAEERILLTRDVELFRRAMNQQAEVFLVEGTNESERLASLALRFGFSLSLDPNASRCPICNAKIRPAEEKEIDWKIPPSTKEVHHRFWECPKCGKVYWQGAHWTKIAATLEKAEEYLEKDKTRHSSLRSHLSGTS